MWKKFSVESPTYKAIFEIEKPMGQALFSSMQLSEQTILDLLTLQREYSVHCFM